MFQFLIPAAASLIGGSMASRSAEKAAATSSAAMDRAAELQRESAREATDLQRRMYEEDVARQQPYYQAGVNALARVQEMAGQPQAQFQYGGELPAAFEYRPEQLTTDPGYQFRLQEGLKALERSAAARGGLMSGATGKALTRFGQEMGSQEFQNAYDRALTGYNALVQREQQQYNRALGQFNLGREQNAEAYNRLAGLASAGSYTAGNLGAAGRAYGTTAGNIGMGTAQQIGNLAMQQGNLAGQAQLAGASMFQRGLGGLGEYMGRYYGQQRNQLAPVTDRSIYPSSYYSYGVEG